MDLSGLLPVIQETAALRRVSQALAGPSLALTLGAGDSAKAPALAALARDLTAPVLVIVPRADHADSLAEELAAWLGDPSRVDAFPERDPLPYERLATDPEAIAQRLRVLSALAAGEARIVVASAKAVAQRTLSPSELASATRELRRGATLEMEAFLYDLSALGYSM
ncbi:MAG: hypothetical protein HYS09_02935, partial [Chloroflexi bacterium]|nr:hypothetical protein [Chloroflexota bacterium]